MTRPVIYFDNSATTQMDKRVVEAMASFYEKSYGNASSIHVYGEIAEEALTTSRASLASLLGVRPAEIVFTSGGSESNNLAIKGVAYANRKKGKHIIISTIEHDCILEPCAWLASEGWDVTCLPVNKDGLVDPQIVENAIRKETVLVSVMHANNEIGTIQPIDGIGKICHAKDVLFHTDACQSFGKIPIDMYNIDLITINSHKIYGPKGAGALYVREGTFVSPLLHGGGQEGGLRAGTENIPGIVGFAKAAEICFQEMKMESERLSGLRDKTIKGIKNLFPDMYLNGHPSVRLPNNINVGFRGREGDAIGLLMRLNDLGIAVSAGSACSSGKKSSHVLKAIGLNPVESLGALRITLGRFNTEEEIDYFLDVLPGVLGSTKSIWSGGI